MQQEKTTSSLWNRPCAFEGQGYLVSYSKNKKVLYWLEMKKELIFKAAKEAGLVRTRSCCEVENKLCDTDEWRGNLESFAYAILKLTTDEDRRKAQFEDYLKTASEIVAKWPEWKKNIWGKRDSGP
jgi:hypothetical protein